MTKAQWKNAWRVRREATFGEAAGNTVGDWNVAGQYGWLDLPPMDIDGLNADQAIIFPTGQSGNRGVNNALPVAGAYATALGSLPMPVYPELSDRFLYNIFGQTTRTETAGTAAKSSVSFASLSTLDTQPGTTEQLKFTISGSSDATSAVINILVDAVIQETITIPDSASSIDGDIYSKGGYASTVTFTVSGTITGGNVVVSGIDYVTSVFTPTTGDTLPTLQIEQQGRPEAGTGNSEFFTGVVIPSINLAYDRNVDDGFLASTMQVLGKFPGAGVAATTFGNDAANHYKPIAGWTGTATIDGVSGSCNRIVSMSLDLASNNELLAASCGSRQPSEAIAGQFELTGQMVIRPDDETDWNSFVNSTPIALAFDFVTPFFVADSVGYQFKIEMSRSVVTNYARSRQGQAQTATLDFRCIYNDTDSGPIKITTRSRLPV